MLRQEIEQAEFTFLPGNFYLIPSGSHHPYKLPVQPDGLITSPSCYGLLEAKRIRPNAFQPEQLAREFVLVMREAQKRQPLLWLILNSEPPVSVRGHGRLELAAAIELYLESVISRAENHELSTTMLLKQVNEVVCWTTWKTITQVVQEQFYNITIPDSSVKACVQRLANTVVRSVTWHS